MRSEGSKMGVNLEWGFPMSKKNYLIINAVADLKPLPTKYFKSGTGYSRIVCPQISEKQNHMTVNFSYYQ
jgi:hypothetical protein